MKSILLLGTYGQTNLGDDLLMYQYIHWLEQLGVDTIHVNVNTQTYVPGAVTDGIKSTLIFHETYHTSITEWIKTIRQVDVVLYGGGSILKELPSATGRGRYSTMGRILLFNALVRILNKRIINLHVGIGRVETRIGRWLTKTALQLCNLTLFRDGESYTFACDTLAMKPDKLRRSTDGAFVNDALYSHQTALELPPPPDDAQRIVGVNLVGESMLPNGYDREAYRRIGLNLVRQLIREKNFVILVPFQIHFNPENDHRFMQEVIMKQLSTDERCYVHLLSELPLTGLRALFTTLDLLVATRFHALVLACIFQTPYLSIEYDTKCARFNSEINYPYRLAITDLGEETFFDLFHRLQHADLDSVRQSLHQTYQQHQTEAHESLRIAVQHMKC